MGNCLCVLGDAMAMPISSMIVKFREELEAHMQSRQLAGAIAVMPRPEPRHDHLPIDGREVQAPENMMLADAAKLGDVEIPVFCYEPKLGQPVGACRMCLVEIEGIPKLQTACSTAVKDGMVVHTQSERARVAQQAVVEFLLINHPLDCPVCDKGGECPLQDITFGWGGGRSRFIEPKRHFRKPLELSPLDRDRPRALHPLLPLRALLAGDLRGLPADPARARRALVRRHLRRPPLRRAVQRQHHRAVPGRRADLAPLPLPRPPLGDRGRRHAVHAVPGSVQRDADGARRARPARARPPARRGRRRLAVRQGPLRLPGDPRRRAHHGADDPRRRRAARRSSWERALARGRGRPAPRRGAAPRRSPARGASNEEGLLLGRLLRDVLGSPHLDSRPSGAVELDGAGARSPAPALAATVSDLEFAHAVLVLDCEPLDDAPILELRIRKGVRRNHVKLFVATDRPSALDSSARDAALRARPRRRARRRAGRRAARRGWPRQRTRPEPTPMRSRRCAAALRDAGEEVVILYGERLLDGGAGGLLELADALGLARHRRARGLIGIPDAANGRGLREAGVPPPASARASPTRRRRRTRHSGDRCRAARRRADRPVPARRRSRCTTCPTVAAWEDALEHATTVIAHAAFLTDTHPRARNGRLPGRERRREGGHRHPPRRARPAAAPGDRPPGRGPRASGRSSPSSRRGSATRARSRSGAVASAALFGARPASTPG